MDQKPETVNFTYDPEVRIGRAGGLIIPSVTDLTGPLTSLSGDVEKGRAIHKATELYDLGTLDWGTVSDSVYPWLMGWVKFREETGFKPSRIEERLLNSTFMVHGQPDREGTWNLNKKRVLLDLKKYKPGKETGVQLGGYDVLLPTLKEPREKIAVELKEYGYQIHYFNEPTFKDIFHSLLNVHWFKKNNNLK